eukprot:Blabericola_migrator_1__5039@NODE_2610_length_2538_cov_336_766491_g1638_i0_p2_GENE_NODE_2610_length_2538_cov_336_766491_g1638_i0NODE_2610_length_2538_cov_336_766491_g1638_i0_p2_ORF_typecomplete_len190_score25_77_NODE_2610_length_2538_cov_336_766491_g1638_i079648
MMRALPTILIFGLLATLKADAESANHLPKLHHPLGLTANRKSQGALPLSIPPGAEQSGSSHGSGRRLDVVSPKAAIMQAATANATSGSGVVVAPSLTSPKDTIMTAASNTSNVSMNDTNINAPRHHQVASIGNHYARLSHPKGVTANRPSLGSQLLVVPPVGTSITNSQTHVPPANITSMVRAQGPSPI